jgi:hypothetical protein
MGEAPGSPHSKQKTPATGSSSKYFFPGRNRQYRPCSVLENRGPNPQSQREGSPHQQALKKGGPNPKHITALGEAPGSPHSKQKTPTPAARQNILPALQSKVLSPVPF